MGERDFAVIEHDHRDVLERHERGLLLLDGKPECSRRSLAGREMTTLRQVTTFLRWGGVEVAEDIDVEFFDAQCGFYTNASNQSIFANCAACGHVPTD